MNRFHICLRCRDFEDRPGLTFHNERDFLAHKLGHDAEDRRKQLAEKGLRPVSTIPIFPDLKTYQVSDLPYVLHRQGVAISWEKTYLNNSDASEATLQVEAWAPAQEVSRVEEFLALANAAPALQQMPIEDLILIALGTHPDGKDR
jgi:hypothetical protein